MAELIITDNANNIGTRVAGLRSNSPQGGIFYPNWPTSDTGQCGLFLQPGFSYWLRNVFAFDLSTLPVGSVVNSAKLRGYVNSLTFVGFGADPTAFYIVASNDGITPHDPCENDDATLSEWNGNPIHGTKNSGDIVVGAWNDFNFSNLSLIVPGGVARFWMINQVDYAGGIIAQPFRNTLIMDLRDGANPPKLTIDYEPPPVTQKLMMML